MTSRRSAAAEPIEAWRRHALFAISIVMMGAGILLGWLESAGDLEFVRGICLKVGIVLFMLWLALPQLQKLNWMAIIPVAVVAAIAVIRPQLIVVMARVIVPLAPVLFLIWLLWSPKKQTRR